ncbi:MAG TPA: sugar ABC transporter ATP-binding protein [Fimbriiglobus sp.]|jgi:ABC-type sugar transport system ATPase subunit|nr:sugar ABC transporter ATP-binding protein [Fimbriiglobus sp.]
MTSAPPLLELSGIEKSFPGVCALRGVSFALSAGEVLAIVGENGAGKSTLIKVLAGAVEPDAGRVVVNSRELPPGLPAEARRAGVAVIYQEFSLVPALTAAENVFLGRESGWLGWLHKRDERRRAEELFRQLGIAVDPAARCRDLTVAQQQAVEIARALAADARVLVMDEPTAALTPPEADRLFALIRELKRGGVGVVYISHRLDEVFGIADRVMVLRDGEHVATHPIRDVTRDGLIELMVGRRLDQEFPKRVSEIGGPRLVVRDLRRGDEVRGVSFEVRRGEVLGLTGLVGSGRTETARLIFGADPRDGGAIELDGRPLRIESPRDAIRAGIALLTEDRKGQGLILAHPVRDNFALPNLGRWSRLGVLDRRRERAAFRAAADRLRIKAANPGAPAATLSGGNQQKVVLAKWLERNCEVVIFDEPTRGIDVGAKYEIYQLVNALAAQGKAVLLISSELPEVLGMCGRVLVMHAGRITGEITDVARATQEDILRLAMG